MKEIFSKRSVSRCYNQDHLAVAVRELLGFSRCELLLLQAGTWGRGYLGNPEEGDWKPLPSNGSEDVIVDTNVCVMIDCKM
jgi:hypothetical protein